MKLSAEHNFAMSVSGRSKGRTGLKVVVRATVPEAGHLWGNKLELSDEIQIQVTRTAITEIHCKDSYVGFYHLLFKLRAPGEKMSHFKRNAVFSGL